MSLPKPGIDGTVCKAGGGYLRDVFSPMDGIALGREYLAEAEKIGEKISSLKHEYKRAPKVSLKCHIQGLEQLQAELRGTGWYLIRRGERRLLPARRVKPSR